MSEADDPPSRAPGQAEIIEATFRSEAGRLARYFHVRLRGAGDPFDMVQEVFARLMTRLRKGEIDNPAAYMTRVAAVNSRMFRAASVSGCCWEPFQDALLGPVGAKAYHQSGWPPLMDDAQDFWSHISLVRNARRVALPILMQQSDDEYLGALASYTALKQAGKPVALFVFPDEHHVKWQPAHRLAVYDRNLAWFDYWLRGIGEVKDILDEAAMQHEVSG